MTASGRIARELEAVFPKERIVADAATRRAYDSDAYPIDRHPPDAVVLPETTEEVSQLVRWCVDRSIPFTPRGAGTGLSGGAMAARGGVVISTKRLTRIFEVDASNRMMHAQSGVPNLRLSKAAAPFGLHFAPDPSSQSVCTLGGNIAENSGGPHTLKYGVTYPHILQVVLVDPTGEALTIGSRCGRSPGPDFLSLIVGGEGTLGIVTEAWVRLTPTPECVETALVAFPSVRQATECVSAIVSSGVIPAALELMDKGIIGALRAAFGLQYPDGSEALLLVECDGNDPEKVVDEMATVESICRTRGALDFRRAQSEAERQDLWKARKKGIGAMGRLAPSIVTHDGVIPRSRLPEMLDFVYRIAAEYGIGVANLFHAGDGNLHPCMYFDDRDPRQVDAVIAVGEAIIARCVELGGSVSGEHGIGVEKSTLLESMFGPDDMLLQRIARGIFNEGDLCNPCKVIPNQRGCIEHHRRSRGVAW